MGLVPLRTQVGEVVIGLENNGGGGRPELRLIRDEDALNNWHAAVGGGKPELVVVVVTAVPHVRGSGWRLNRLEQQTTGFGRHVRLITGASGGMPGTGYYRLGVR